MQMKVVIASGNQSKVEEIERIFSVNSNLKFKLQRLPDTKIPEPYEPFDTCMENAIHKAKHYANFTGCLTLSEDAGLYIDGLEGFPGVKTKNFILESKGLNNAILKLEQLLQNVDNKAAYFNCSAAIYHPELDQIISHEAVCRGTLQFPPKGEAGFGFDPIFVPEGYAQTMAELGMERKNQIGHRGLALLGLAEKLIENPFRS